MTLLLPMAAAQGWHLPQIPHAPDLRWLRVLRAMRSLRLILLSGETHDGTCPSLTLAPLLLIRQHAIDEKQPHAHPQWCCQRAALSGVEGR